MSTWHLARPLTLLSSSQIGLSLLALFWTPAHFVSSRVPVDLVDEEPLQPTSACSQDEADNRPFLLLLLLLLPSSPDLKPSLTRFRSTSVCPFWLLPLPPPCISTLIARKEVTANELLTRVKSNGYKGAHREEDCGRDRRKHEDKTKRDQDSALDRYVLSGIFWPLGKDRC